MGQACLEIALIYRFADNFRIIVGTNNYAIMAFTPPVRICAFRLLWGYHSFQLVNAAFHYLKKAYAIWRIVLLLGKLNYYCTSLICLLFFYFFPM